MTFRRVLSITLLCALLSAACVCGEAQGAAQCSGSGDLGHCSHQAEHAHDHLSLFAVLAIFSMCTDTLALAADTVDSRFMEVVTWVLLVSKLLVVLVLICKREAFV
jgi:hypothetical protein